ncbi:MAG: OmpA family protein [Betaproteobacteria bacterium]
MFLFAIGLAGLLYLGLTAQPTSTVVLLPDAEGRAGRVDLQTDAARQTLDAPYASAHVSNRGTFVARTENADQIQQRYAQTLAARPAMPVSFTLVFESGSAVELAPEFNAVLDQLLAAIARHPAPEVTVIGHTDRVGSDADNDLLSIRRAETVRDKLVQAGVPASMISVAGRGEREPAVATADGVALAENRRVEINVR